MILVCFAMMLLCSLTGCSGEKEGILSEDWKKQSSTAVASHIYQDSAGNQIVYYCCKTTYYNGAVTPAVGTLDRQALSAVIDLDQVSGIKECAVWRWPALLCQQDDRSYLCWTISPEYSCVIEYDANAVTEDDIFRMAESVVQK